MPLRGFMPSNDDIAEIKELEKQMFKDYLLSWIQSDADLVIANPPSVSVLDLIKVIHRYVNKI